MKVYRPSETVKGYLRYHTGDKNLTWVDGVEPARPLPIRSQQEVADIMTAAGYPMTQSAVSATEMRALQKLRDHPLMSRLFAEMLAAL